MNIGDKMNRKDLANKIWKACDIMRRDDGTTGILEYMEQLSWMIFLKIFEDLEKRMEEEAKFEGREYKPIIKKEYQWSSWTKKDFKGDDLVEFIDRKLFPYLRSLEGTKEKEQIAAIFEETRGNRMKSVYNLKDVINLLDTIDFNKAEDTHVLSQIYEELLLRLGREGGVAGEFYTPRPIIRLMVKIVNPKIGEKVFDPFCGSGGFLIESYNHMKESVKTLTIKQYEKLQKETFYGQEKKPLPYLMGIMNCVVHGISTPNIIRTNTLEKDIRNIPEKDRYEVILTNPPFGGKEGNHIQQNFPVKSHATELLALQYVMKHLKSGGRCGIVIPEGILFREQAFAKVKKELIENYNLHTIISLPSGVFANVSSSGQGPKTNLLFFKKDEKTSEIWYYDFASYSEIELNKKYTKASPIEDDDLIDCLEKWKNKAESKYSWLIKLEKIIASNYDLTARNSNIEKNKNLEKPEVIIKNIISIEKEILSLLNNIRKIVKEGY